MSILLTCSDVPAGAAIVRGLLEDACDGGEAVVVVGRAAYAEGAAAILPWPSDDNWESTLAEAARRAGPVRAVLMDLGAPTGGSLLHQVSLEEWDRRFDRGARSPWLLAKAAMRHIATPGGVIVAIGDAHPGMARPRDGVEAVANEAVSFLLQALSRELEPSGGRALVISPGAEEFTTQLARLVLRPEGIGANGIRLKAQGKAAFPAAAAPALAVAGRESPSLMRALITGGGGEIAKALCRVLQARALMQATAPPRAFLVDVNGERLDETAGVLSGEGLDVRTLHGDMGDPALAAQAVAAAVEAFGGLDAVFSNAAAAHGERVSEMPPEIWSRCFDVTVRGAWLLAKASFEALSSSGGAFVATGSIGGLSPGLSAPVYSASKAALARLVRQLAIEWAPAGVRANMVVPGSTLTPMNRLWGASEDVRAAVVALYPMKRMATPAEIAAVLAFAAGQDASYITGQALVVDGGLSLVAPP